MRKIDVEKKRATKWPWLLGVVLLALVVWGATVLLRPPAEEEGPDLPVTTADTLPPSAIPSSSGGASAAPRAQSLARLMPLGEEDIGQTVQVEGEVVATGNNAFWMVSGSSVLRVDSYRRARKGDSLSVRGVLQSAEEALTDQMATDVLSRDPAAERWTVIRSLKLVDDQPPPGAADDST